MAWKMLDIARAITDKHSTDTMEKVDILSALAEISLEREDIESSLSDYKKSSVHLRAIETSAFACLETGCQTKEAIPYCQKAILICKSRMERLTNEVKCPSGTATSSAVSEIDQGIQQSSDVPCIDDKSASEKEAEIRTLSGLAEELEKKASLEDLKHQAREPKSTSC
ncbi:Tetratricopeptide repeat (TPR)-like superfamily protein [Raphanus sativus]|nr:Tetratricopeptide repeat (TPR)-like superfamily protein [Raphanus sativus]